MGRINLLPHWHLTNQQPAFYDLESATAVDMVAKVYGAMRELQDDYNKYVNEINKTITEFVDSTNRDQECFINEINKIVLDYIEMLDTKIKTQDLAIAKAVEFMTINLSNSITELLTKMKNNGELDEAFANSFTNIGNRIRALENTEYTLEIEEGTENLVLVKTVKEGE